jgi:PKD repeat protein
MFNNIAITQNGSILLQNLIISNNLGVQGGGLYANNGISITLDHARFSNNRATQQGGGAVGLGAVNINNGVFYNNQSQGGAGGGGLVVGSATYLAPLTLTNTQFISNSASTTLATSPRGGGGLLAYGTATLNGGLFQSNTMTNGNGGGMFVANLLWLSGTQFISNSVSGGSSFGGGVSANSDAVITNSVFQLNTSQSGSAGGLFVGGTLSMTNTQILSNTAYGSGGGASVSLTTTVSSSLFRNNQCTNGLCDGGALFTDFPLSLIDTQFISNSAGNSGGAFHANYTTTLTTVTLTNNTSGNSGGGGSVLGAAIVSGGLFQNNQCAQTTCAGGGLNLSGPLIVVTGTQFLSNRAGNNGGAVNTGSDATLNYALFQNNRSLGGNGGGINTPQNLWLTQTQFISNVADTGGGGAYADTVIVKGGLFQGNTTTSTVVFAYGGGVFVITNLVLTDTVFDGNRSSSRGGGAYVGDTATLNGGIFQNNVSAETFFGGGGGLGIGGGTLQLSGTQFLSNTAYLEGGGIFILGAGLSNLNHGLFQNNRCTSDGCSGGAISVGGTSRLTSTQFISNAARGIGGGFVAVGATTLTDTLFQNNRSETNSGGGLYAYLTASLTNTRFLSNTADAKGGGAYVGGAATLNTSSFQNNRALSATSGFGGGLFASSALVANATQFISNAAYQRGGGIYANNAATLHSSLLQANTSISEAGGGLYISDTLTVTSTQFLSNVARFNGGGFYGSSESRLTSAWFQHNTSLLGQGGAVFAVLTTTLTNTHFLSNTANLEGGGAYVISTTIAQSSTFQYNTSQTNVGGGLFVYDTLRVTNTRFLHNYGFYGAGLYAANGAMRVVNALFAANVGNTTLHLNMPSTAVVLHTTIATPTLSGGSGIYAATGDVFITNTIIASHTLGIESISANAYADYNLFFGNGTDTTGSITNGIHSLNDVPNFVNPTNDDYHLGAGSAAINEAVSSAVMKDFENETRSQGDAPDIGYDESPYNTADLRIVKTIPSSSVAAGERITYTLTYTNGGPLIAKNVIVTDLVPTQLSAISYQSSALVTPTVGITFAWQVGKVHLGEMGVITLTGIVSANLANDTRITNTATITTSIVDTNTTNNTSTVIVTVTLPTLSIADVSVSEGDTLTKTVVFTVTLSAPALNTVTVNYGSSNGSATAPSDYLTATGTLTFGWGATTQLISVTIVGDTTYESNETFTITLSGASGATIADAQGIGTMLNDDAQAIAGLNISHTTPTLLGRVITFTANITAGTNVSYQWNFGDGAGTGISSTPTTTHTYNATGTHNVVVTATNSVNTLTATTTIIITNATPLANAGADQIVFVNSTVTLNGSGSTDPDGHTPLVYRWTQTDGTNVVLNNASNVTATFSAPTTPQVLSFTLRVSDTFGASSSDTVMVTVTDRSIMGLSAQTSAPSPVGRAVAFTATITDGTNVTYVWAFGDGAPTASGANVTHIYSSTGAFIAIVTATNSASVVTTTVVATITNAPPIANAGADQTVFISVLVTLNGSSSSDPDGHTPLTYRWTQSGGAAVSLSSINNATTTFTAPATSQALSFTLRVTDTFGASSSDTVVITISNAAPAGLRAYNSSPTTLGGVTAFTATITGGGSISYQWNFGDGALVSSNQSPVISHTYPTVGFYTTIVTATNAAGSIAATTRVTITDAPISNLTVSTGPSPTATVGATTLFTATANGSNIAYTWNFGDGSVVVNGSFIAHTYALTGTFTVIVTATNSIGFTRTQTTLNVISPPTRRVYLPLVVR